MSARDINDLRTWVNQYENAPGIPDPQGIVSFCYDPDVPAIVTDAWCDNVSGLKTAGQKLLIRTNIKSRSSDNALLATDVIGGYQSGLDVWTGRGYGGLVGGVLTAEFDRPSGIPGNPQPNTPPTGETPLSNPYIDDFANRAYLFAQQVAPKGMRTFWVWNEPDVTDPPGTYLAPEVFGAMCYQACIQLKAGAASVGVSPVTTYAGGMSVTPPRDPAGDNAVAYLTRMYEYLNAFGVGGSSPSATPYPWSAISINMEYLVDPSYVQTVFGKLINTQDSHSDFTGFVVGEWGVQNNAIQPYPNDAPVVQAYNALRRYFPTMYFFQHPARVVGNANDYGTTNYDYPGGLFRAKEPFTWYGELRDHIYPLP